MKEKKCAIFNYWWSPLDGHGASLTALALYSIVENLGYEPCLIKTMYGNTIEECESGRHYRFIKKYARMTEKNYITNEEYETLNDEFTHFIVGSDQVFRVEWVPDGWFLNSIDESKNKIAMSASFGVSQLTASEKRLKRVKGYVKRIRSISLRELDGIEVYYKYFGYRDDLQWIMDPVFLVEKSFYKSLQKNSCWNEKQYGGKDIIFFYILDMTVELETLKEHLSNKSDVILIEDTLDLMAEDFLKIMDYCSMVITDSFHGMCFSIIYNKPFYGLYNILRGTSRIETLKKVFPIEHVIVELDELQKFSWEKPIIDYSAVDKIIKIEQKRGIGWLKEKLDKYMLDTEEYGGGIDV